MKLDDPVYLRDEHFGEPKEYFKLILELLGSNSTAPARSLADVGCASGAFLHFASKALPLDRVVGFDPATSLLEEARKRLATIEFFESSLLDDPPKDAGTFDVVTCLGVLSLLDDLHQPLRHLSQLTKVGGRIIIYDILNDDPVDVWMRYRRSDLDGDWEPGFNLRSRVSYETAILKAAPKARIEWLPFRMPFPLSKQDPMRAWTVETEENPHQLVVGTGQMLNFCIISIEV